MNRKISITTALIVILFFSIGIAASDVPRGEITFLQGESFVGTAKNGPWRSVTKGMLLNPGQLIKTGMTGIVEITLPDKSVIRLASDTLYQLDETIFPKNKRHKFSARLFFGNMWARASKVMGVNGGSFDVKTPIAIVGIRGTVCNIHTALDRSTLVSVYQGTVGVSHSSISKGADREEISWPAEVSEKKWEEIILKRLQRLFIGSDGIPGKPESFDPVKEKDDWADWNLKRDAMQTGASAIGSSPSG